MTAALPTVAGDLPMDLPECPVCLQPYDATTTVPRVLPCGHSACELCLAALPSRPSLPSTIRCPACNQTVRLPRPPGPSALPKNIDLIRLTSPHPPPHNPNPKPQPSPEFIPLPFAHQLFDEWEDHILPADALTRSDASLLATSNKNQQVSLLPISVAPTTIQSSYFRLSHAARAMEAVTQLPETVRDELGCVFQVSSRRVCEVYGLWMDPSEESKLFLVCEAFGRRVLCGWDVKEEVNVFAMMGMEMCEAVMELHSRGVVCGCLGVDCFGLDEYGHSFLDLNGVLLAARRIREPIKAVGDESLAFVSPEVLISLVDNGDATNCVGDESLAFVSPEVLISLVDNRDATNCGYQSDVWSLACVLIMVMLDDRSLAAELFDGFVNLISKGLNEYEAWREKLISKLEVHLGSTELHFLLQILSSCLNYDMKSRPSVNELWRCIRSLFVKNQADDMAVPEVLLVEESTPCCLILGDLCSPCNKGVNVLSRQQNGSLLDSTSDVSLVGSSGNCSQQEEVGADLIKGMQRGGFKSVTLYGHQDCITRLAVGGGFLFSSSFDKTVHVWSLQDFSLVQSLRGHEHKVMAMAVLDAGEPLCISGDSGSNILVWRVDKSLGSEPLKKWSEHNDWRYSGVHSLAISGTEYLYSGSGDKSIKAWSLKDYSLSCTMTGHRSTVSSLVVADGILYSGSWDGTIRLWLISDHSPLSILGDDTPGSSPPVLALSVDHHLLASSYENGLLKIWRNEVPVRTMQLQNGAIFALHVDKKWLFTGGWDKIVSIQELLENELQVDIRPVASVTCDALISSLLYYNGKLFIGLSNKEIKVYGCGY